LGLEEVFPDPFYQNPIDYGILCSLFPEHCGFDGGGVGFAIIKDVLSETGGEPGGAQWPGPAYLQAYKLIGPAYDPSGTKVVGWRYSPTCQSFICGPVGDKIVKKRKGPFLQCGGGTVIIPTPPSILCLGACFGMVTPGKCDTRPWPF
jgi:hypothetical protein